jgi:hypothetical protein
MLTHDASASVRKNRQVAGLRTAFVPLFLFGCKVPDQAGPGCQQLTVMRISIIAFSAAFCLPGI